jgi:hypothetical protein
MYSVQPYAEVYGVHPREFDFDAFGNKLSRNIESCADSYRARDDTLGDRESYAEAYRARDDALRNRESCGDAYRAREGMHLGRRSPPIGFFTPHDQYDYGNIF